MGLRLRVPSQGEGAGCHLQERTCQQQTCHRRCGPRYGVCVCVCVWVWVWVWVWVCVYGCVCVYMSLSGYGATYICLFCTYSHTYIHSFLIYTLFYVCTHTRTHTYVSLYSSNGTEFLQTSDKGLILRDHDTTNQIDGTWKKINTLGHYNLTEVVRTCFYSLFLSDSHFRDNRPLTTYVHLYTASRTTHLIGTSLQAPLYRHRSTRTTIQHISSGTSLSAQLYRHISISTAPLALLYRHKSSRTTIQAHLYRHISSGTSL